MSDPLRFPPDRDAVGLGALDLLPHSLVLGPLLLDEGELAETLFVARGDGQAAAVVGLRVVEPAEFNQGIADAAAGPHLEVASGRGITKPTSASRPRRDGRDLSGSRFENDTALYDRLDRQTSTRAAEAVVWKHLEGRRTWWAMVIARTAATLRTATGDWAAGFTAFVTDVKSAWPSRALAADDKRVLTCLARAAKAGIDDGLARLVNWRGVRGPIGAASC